MSDFEELDPRPAIDQAKRRAAPSDVWNAELDSIELVQHALAYARKGWAVMPLWWCRNAWVCACPMGEDCGDPGKHPLTAHGYKDASTDPVQIAAWWRKWPYANIGIATGAVSGFFVLDVDEHGGETIDQLFRKHGRPGTTIASVTGSGGRHVLWRCPDVAIRNRVRFAPGLDTRSDGGHIVAPPSLHACGNRYEWHEQGHPARVRLGSCPGWMVQLITAPATPPRTGPRRNFRPEEPKPRIELDAVPPITEGERNRKLYSLACRMRWEGRTDGEVHDGLLYVNNRKVSPPLDEREVAKIARSACRHAIGT